MVFFIDSHAPIRGKGASGLRMTGGLGNEDMNRIILRVDSHAPIMKKGVSGLKTWQKRTILLY
jgi:hypothetical protein